MQYVCDTWPLATFVPTHQKGQLQCVSVIQPHRRRGEDSLFHPYLSSIFPNPTASRPGHISTPTPSQPHHPTFSQHLGELKGAQEDEAAQAHPGGATGAPREEAQEATRTAVDQQGLL